MSTKKKSTPKKSSVRSVKNIKITRVSENFKTTQVSKPDFSKIEKEAIQRADRTLSTIETFLVNWDSSKQKPSSMNQQVSKVKRFYDALSLWQKSTLKAQKSKFDESAAKKRLAAFVHICQNYS
ncbi:MAG: hypothetical protein ACP5N9_05965 [Candidatus Bilamarchaeum sp.]|jgi:tRNA U34 5-carboxymethylaminomethyl modifying GTPase MnmE/TrmE